MKCLDLSSLQILSLERILWKHFKKKSGWIFLSSRPDTHKDISQSEIKVLSGIFWEGNSNINHVYHILPENDSKKAWNEESPTSCYL